MFGRWKVSGSTPTSSSPAQRPRSATRGDRRRRGGERRRAPSRSRPLGGGGGRGARRPLAGRGRAHERRERRPPARRPRAPSRGRGSRASAARGARRSAPPCRRRSPPARARGGRGARRRRRTISPLVATTASSIRPNSDGAGEEVLQGHGRRRLSDGPRLRPRRAVSWRAMSDPVPLPGERPSAGTGLRIRAARGTIINAVFLTSVNTLALDPRLPRRGVPDDDGVRRLGRRARRPRTLHVPAPDRDRRQVHPAGRGRPGARVSQGDDVRARRSPAIVLVARPRARAALAVVFGNAGDHRAGARRAARRARPGAAGAAVDLLPRDGLRAPAQAADRSTRSGLRHRGRAARSPALELLGADRRRRRRRVGRARSCRCAPRPYRFRLDLRPRDAALLRVVLAGRCCFAGGVGGSSSARAC